MPATMLRLLPSRTVRGGGLALIGALFVLLLAYEAMQTQLLGTHRPPGTLWAWYATYALIGALFFGVGALIWLYSYARQRLVATLLFGFCSLLTIAFGTLSGASLGDIFSNALGESFTAISTFCLFLLLLRFPHKLRPHRAVFRQLLGLLQVAVGVLCLICVCLSLINTVYHLSLPSWLYFLGLFYYILTTLLIVAIIVVAALARENVRTIQQTRLFLAGTLLSFVPILFLTIIPTILHLSANIDGTRSMISLVFFPIAMAYSLLRYELLVFDRYVRQAVTWVIGGVGILLLAYLLFAVCSQLLGGSAPLILAGLVGVGVISAPAVWSVSRRLSEQFFFPETAYYAARLKELHASQRLGTFDLPLASHQMQMDVLATLQPPEVCLFILDEETQSYRLMPLQHREERGVQENAGLLTELVPLLLPEGQESVRRIAETHPSIKQLGAANRPLFLSEIAEGARAVAGLARYLKSDPQGIASDPLLAPIKAPNGQVIGIIALGERGDHQMYAGPEFEVLQHLLDQAAPGVETARLYELAIRQQATSQRELELAYEQQRVLNEQKDQFIIHVSHELRTPLSAVTGYLDLLAASGDELEPEMRALFIEKALFGGEELQRLIETILDAAQSSFVSPLPLRLETVVLNPVMHEVLNHLEPQAARTHPIDIQIEESLSVFADAHALGLILENLVSNALKYTPAGTPISIRAETSWRADTEEPEVCIFVQDRGPGIPPAEASKLFGKFARLQRDLSGSIRGTGLGLYINKQLVESMGGRIWLESSGIVGEGSLFCFTLREAGVSKPAPNHAESVPV
ncbi:MAG TPA: ATP-binding protein [Ktedonobacteraceae bacterium]|nr:ATP-binding protein [Ktedonobacteraceae bacterium]